jgi:hypothetical protein
MISSLKKKNIRRGWISEAGELQVECSGCTEAYAGVEVNFVMKKMRPAGMTKEEKDKIKKAHPIDASSHDLLASCLTIFAGVFGKSQADKPNLGGSEGSKVLHSYWG